MIKIAILNQVFNTATIRLCIEENKNILIISPHPDDEIFGLGGYILKMMELGVNIHLIYLTDGENSAVWPDREEIKYQRIILSEKVCRSIGLEVNNITRLHLPDSAVPYPDHFGFDIATKSVKEIIDRINPDIIFSTHSLDYWPFDHVACAKIAIESVKQSSHKPQLWFYWVWAWYNIRLWNMLFKKNYGLQKIDISDQLSEKKILMNIYLNSLTSEGKPWSGILPPSLLKAFEFPYEIVERIM